MQSGCKNNVKGNSVVKSCYHVGLVTGAEKVGSIVGEVIDQEVVEGDVFVENCYSIMGQASTTANGISTVYDVAPVSESMLKRTAFVLGDAFIMSPSNDLNNGFPVFKWQSYIPLLQWLLANPDSKISESNWKDFDMNNDGKHNAIDLTLMKRELLK